jgi:hypothetical protein
MGLVTHRRGVVRRAGADLIRRPSALPSIADIVLHCREPPLGASCRPLRCSKTVCLFNYLVRDGRKRRRHLDAERLGGPEIYQRFIFGQCLDWKVSRVLALKDAVDVACCSPESNYRRRLYSLDF